MWAWQQKRPRALIWHKTAIFLSMDGLIFTKHLRVDSLTSNRYITAVKSIKYHVKYNIWPKLSFSDPPTPLSDLVFRPALSHFLADFNKKVSKCSVDHTASYKLVP